MRKVTLIAFFCSFNLLGFFEVQIPSIDEQISLYKDIYRDYAKEGFDPQTTHIDNYKKILPIAFSYTHSLVSASNQRLVYYFWKKCLNDLENQKMTIAHYKKTIMRLALLVSNSQEKGAFYYASGLLRTLQDRFALYNFSLKYDANALNSGFINNKNMLEVHPYPFCFEAILFHPQGEFSFDHYLSSLLDDDMTLSLSVFPASGDGPHNNFLKSSAAFLLHDFAHWAIFVNNFAEQNWRQIKSALQNLYQNHRREQDKALLFMLTHELPHYKEEQIPDDVYEILQHWLTVAHQYLENAASYTNPKDMVLPSLHLESDDVIWHFGEEEKTHVIFLKNQNNESVLIPVYFKVLLDEFKHDYGVFFTIKKYEIVDVYPSFETRLNENFPGMTMDEFYQKVYSSSKNYSDSVLSHTFFYDVLFHDLTPLINNVFNKEKLLLKSDVKTITDSFKELSEKYLSELNK